MKSALKKHRFIAKNIECLETLWNHTKYHFKHFNQHSQQSFSISYTLHFPLKNCLNSKASIRFIIAIAAKRNCIQLLLWTTSENDKEFLHTFLIRTEQIAKLQMFSQTRHTSAFGCYDVCKCRKHTLTTFTVNQQHVPIMWKEMLEIDNRWY